MKFKSKKAIAANSLVVIFALFAIFAPAFNFLRHGSITGFNIMQNENGINDIMDWNTHIYIGVCIVLASVVLVAAVLNFFLRIKLFSIIKVNLFSVLMVALGVIMIVMSVFVFKDTMPIREKNLDVAGNVAIGWIVLFLSSLFLTITAVGTQFFNK